METWVGRSVERREDPRLLTGRGRYLADVRLAGMLEAVFVRSAVAHGVPSLDVTAATAAPGVTAVFTAATLPPHRPLVDTVTVPGLRKTPQPPLATDRVRFVGEPVALVVAADRYVGEDAAALVDADYEPLAAAADAEAAMAGGAPLLFPDVPGNVVFRETKTFGEPAPLLGPPNRVYRSEFRGGRVSAAPLETRGCIADFDPARGELTVWSSTQGHHLLRRRLATTTGLPEQRIRVIVPDVGGGFGQKIPAAPEEVAVALAAMALGRPVRWVEDRRENLVAAPHAKEQIVTTEIAVTPAGTFAAMRARVVGDSGAYSFNPASALIEPYLSALLMPGVYTIEHFEVEIVAVLTNKAPVSPYRGVGWTASHTAREMLIDRIAADLGIDPAELRRRNLIPAGAMPYRTCTGMVYDSGDYPGALDEALAAIGYDDLRRTQHEHRPEGRRLGIGISPYVEPTGWGSEGAAQSHWSFASYDAAAVTMDPSGGVTVAVGTPAQGQGHETTLAQLAADALGVHPDAVRVRNDDTAATPVSVAGTRASRTAVVSGGAVQLAAGALADRLRAVAATLLEAAPEDVVLHDGQARVVGAGGEGLPLERVAAAAYFDPVLRRDHPEPHLSEQRFYDPGATYSNGCIVCAVEVDPGTGGVRILDLVAVEDCGRMINPMIVDGQIRGAAAQGVGAALLERVVYDGAGQALTGTLLDYLLPTAADVPRVRIRHMESPSPVTVGGIKGMGESGMIAVPAAVANAIMDAVPRRPAIDHIPLDPGSIAALFTGEETA